MDFNWMLEEYDGIVYVCDMQTYELVYMNREGCKQFGVKKEDILQGDKICYEVLQGLTEPCPFCTNSNLEETHFYEWEHYNAVLDTTYLIKDRKFKWDDRVCRIEFATDITEYRHKIEHKEKERESVLRSLPGGIVRVDARDARTVLWYGANFLNMIGYTAEQFEKELNNQCGYIHPDDLDRVTEIMTTLKETGKIVITDMRMITRSGDVRTLTTTFSYEDGDASEDGIPSYYSVGIDITEIKAAQEKQADALRDAYRAAQMANAAKTDFLSNMSHDIRTPMNAIIGMTAIAGANINNPERVQDCLEKINRSSRHLLGLINEVLDMSRIENGRVNLVEDNFSLADVIQNVLELCQPMIREKCHRVNVNIGQVQHENLVGDIERLQQVFVNLMSNAIKYTPDGGNIEFEIKEKEFYVPGMSLFQFVFRDNGIGMSQEFLKHIFEPFSRAQDSRINKIQGTGLGMSISENIVHMMNGTIRVESVLGEGSCFYVDIPLLLQEGEEETVPELDNLSVLVVDDEPDVCESACILLKQIGMRGNWVNSGAEAVKEIVRAQKQRDGYFAVILDWKMPDMNGLETTRAIRAAVGDEIPIIIVSAYDYSEVEQDLIDAGVNGFISKPLFKSRMVQVFRKLADNQELVENLPETAASLSGCRVLLVEDNELNREIAGEILGMVGAEVEMAEDGREAVEKFAASPCNYYDVILMDIQMPVMSGYEASQRIRSMDRKDAETTVILALTANAFLEDVIESQRAGINEHISKPVSAEKLYSVISRWIS